ncbi:hypothetical protein [Myxosarcina sp. GI1]|uniref:WD40/YVTN/BNR-like repeat-containing protein n=1 Tax=Myxosarcina sp. GI1 TaxID=1541065 RepID=UPI00056B7082|nr:hypothetical protein [Myxosarcina sp. GI1]
MVSVKQHQPLETIKPSSVNKNYSPQAIAGTTKGLWLSNDSQQDVEHSEHQIDAIAYSNDDLWVVSDLKSVLHRNNAGKWTELGSVEDLELKCILPLKAGILAGTSEAHLIRVNDNNIEFINSFDKVEGRSEWYTPWGGAPAVRSMASSQNELYINVHVGGILRSQDGGRSWQPTIDIHADVHQVLTVANRPNLVLAATGEGLAISRDRGDSWQFEQQRLHSAYCRAVAVCGNSILITVSDGPRGSRAAVYRFPLDGSGVFEKCQQGLPKWFSHNINTSNLVASGNKAIFGTSDGNIFASEDAGLTWKQLATGLPSIKCVALI